MQPKEFWALTPREFAVFSGAAMRPPPTTAQRLADLMEQFPDIARTHSEGGQ